MTSARLVTVASHPPAPLSGRGEEDVVSWGLLAGLARRRWLLMLLSVVLSLGAAMGYLWLTPPIYEAGASLLVEGEQYNLPEMVKRLSTQSDVNTQLEVLKSTGLAERVARELALRVTTTAFASLSLALPGDLGSRIAPSIPRPVPRSRLFSAITVGEGADTGTVVLTRLEDNRFWALEVATGEVVDSLPVGAPATIGGVTFTLAPEATEYPRIRIAVGTLAGAVEGLRQEVRMARADRDVDVIWIRYKNPDPVLAGQVPDLLASHYLESRVDNARAKIVTAVGFLKGQADTLQGQLLAAEQELRDYREQQGIVDLPAEANSQVTQGAEVGTRRLMLEAEYSALQRLITEADTAGTSPSSPSPYRRLAGFPSLINNQAVSGQLHTLSDLEDQRAQLLERRTPQDPDVTMLDRRIGDVDAQLRGLTNAYLEGLRNQIGSLDVSLKNQSAKAARIPTKSMDEERLARKPRLLGDVYAMVQTRLQEARIAEIAADPGVRLIDRAEVPTRPVWPRANLVLLVALAVGVLGGGALAWMREGLDESVHSRADVIRAAGAPLLALIPRIRMLRPKARRAPPRLVAGSPQGFGARASRRRTELSHRALLLGGKDRSGAALEAYAWLETSLALTHPADAPRTVAFTSPLSREGKTINAANLALSVARRGKRVLLIDADLRRGMIHHLFGVSQDRGLAEVLAGQVSLEQSIRCLPLGEGAEVHVLPCGVTAGHPAAAFRSEALRDLLAKLTGRYDLILVDSPPVNLVSDPLVLAGMVDGVILVARAGVTEAAALAEAAQHLREAGAPLLGVLLNDIDVKRDSSYDDAYRYLDQAGAYAAAAGARTAVPT